MELYMCILFNLVMARLCYRDSGELGLNGAFSRFCCDANILSAVGVSGYAYVDYLLAVYF